MLSKTYDLEKKQTTCQNLMRMKICPCPEDWEMSGPELKISKRKSRQGFKKIGIDLLEAPFAMRMNGNYNCRFRRKGDTILEAPLRPCTEYKTKKCLVFSNQLKHALAMRHPSQGWWRSPTKHLVQAVSRRFWHTRHVLSLSWPKMLHNSLRLMQTPCQSFDRNENSEWKTWLSFVSNHCPWLMYRNHTGCSSCLELAVGDERAYQEWNWLPPGSAVKAKTGRRQ